MFTLEQATKAQKGSRCIVLYFYILGARWPWVINAMCRSRYPRERPDTHRIGDWVGPTAGLNGCGKSRPHKDPSRTAQAVASRYKDQAIPAGEK
jgi:hypothetical protein